MLLQVKFPIAVEKRFKERKKERKSNSVNYLNVWNKVSI